MKSKFFTILFKNILFIIFFSIFHHCKTTYHVDKITYENNTSISQDLGEDAYVNKFIMPYKKQIDSTLNSTIATASTNLTSEGLSSNLGNLLANLVLESAQEYSQKNGLPNVDIALLNHGGMRVNLSKGPISVRKVYELMPFENNLVIVTLTGRELDGFIDYMLQSHKGHPIAGVSLEYENGKIKQALIHGKPIETNRKYVIATHNYLYNGGDNMKFFKPNEGAIDTPIKIRDIFIDGFEKLNILPDIQEDRIIIIE